MALTDESLQKMLVGGLEPFRAVIEDHDPEWAVRGAVWVEALTAALGNAAVRVEHVGSTSVPGLAAKPVIDLLATVADPETQDLAALGELGFELRVTSPGRRTLRTRDRSAQVHVLAEGSATAAELVALRDHLRAHPESRRRYAELKRILAQQEWKDMHYYSEAKGELIREFLAC